VEKIKYGFSELKPDDVCVICGDISWALNLEDAKADFCFIGELPGKKIILKGNHDYWWSTATKAKQFLGALGIDSIDFLNNNCFFYGENAAICGTRGWFYEEEKGGEHDKKMILRELGRLETSLKAAGEKEKYVFLHYPPKYGRYECPELLDMLQRYEVKLCASGHIHGPGLKLAFEGVYRGTEHLLVSGDKINFKPVKILD